MDEDFDPLPLDELLRCATIRAGRLKKYVVRQQCCVNNVHFGLY